MPSSSAPRPRAVLVGVQLPGVSDVDHAGDLAELGRLVHTLGYEVVATVSQKRSGLAAGSVLGSGKLQVLAQLTGGSGNIPTGASGWKSKARLRWEDVESDGDGNGESNSEGVANESPAEAPGAENAGGAAALRPTVIVVDHELSPSQARNLERATGTDVVDRTGVIVDIFHRHAKSREARMQVEIARLSYLAPRLREGVGGSERQQGRGAGESELELDRRKIRDRVAELKGQLSAIQQDQAQRRFARKDQLRVALVGYTNAGKSSLMRALTGSEVQVADRLFATLDTTVRALQPQTHPRILVSDTVGFIKKVPHDLVASFRSTLDEALEASLLLYVVDAADATAMTQLEVTRSVLHEIGADAVPSLLLLNKADRIDEAKRAEWLAALPEAIVLSARAPADVAALRARIIEQFETAMVEASLVIPYSKQGLISQVYEQARVLSETFEEDGRHFVVRALPAAAAKLTRLVAP